MVKIHLSFANFEVFIVV